MINRRRFLKISAAAAGASFTNLADAKESPTIWRGRAFGAEAKITLLGEQNSAVRALEAALDTVRRLETYFSLYDPASLLSVLNRDGQLTMPPEFARLMDLVDIVHQQSSGLFDPTIQPRFLARLRGTTFEQRDPASWRNVRRRGAEIGFDRPGMALTFNGIAQGFATDRVSEVLAAHGFERMTVNIGEYRLGADGSTLEVRDVEGNALDTIEAANAAIATSSSHGFTFPDGSGHILSPSGRNQQPAWKTASVVAETAAMADGFSTALMLTGGPEMAKRLVSDGLAQKVILQNFDGKISQITRERAG